MLKCLSTLARCASVDFFERKGGLILKVKIIETLERIIDTSIDDYDMAEYEAEDQWKRAEIVLSADDFASVKFIALKDG